MLAPQPNGAPPRRDVVVTDEARRPHELAQRLDVARAAGLRPVVVLFADPSASLDPLDRRDTLFIDLTGTSPPAASNVRRISSRVFLEMVLVHVRRAMDDGAKHLLIDDMATMEFYCGTGATQGFMHSLATTLRLAGAGWDLFITDDDRAAPLRSALSSWLD